MPVCMSLKSYSLKLKLANIDFKENVSRKRDHRYANEIISNKSLIG